MYRGKYCGSNGAPCVLEVKRVDGGTEASVTPNIANFPKDGTECIKTGANVTWQGAGKNTGVMVDFGETSPFEPSGTIIGGSDRSGSVVAKKAGCFKYTGVRARRGRFTGCAEIRISI